MQEHAGAARQGRVTALEVRDVVTLPSQLDGGGYSADAVANDGDTQRMDHVAGLRLARALDSRLSGPISGQISNTNPLSVLARLSGFNL